MKLKKGDKLIFIGVMSDSQKNISKIIFESPAGNKIIIRADGDQHEYHYLGFEVPDEKKPEEELDIS